MPLWTVDVEGTPHTVEYVKKGLRGHLFIDNIEEPIRSRVPFFVLMDKTIWLANKPAQIVIVRGAADLAVDGVFLTSGEPYRPVNRIPWFVWLIFFLAFFLGLLMADLAGMALGILGGYFCLRVAIIPDLPVKKQMLYCLGILAACLAVDVGLHFLIDLWMGEEGELIEMQLMLGADYTGVPAAE